MAKQTIYNAGIYVRLSQEDMRAGESLSIENQKLILTKYVKEQGWNLVDTYVDATVIIGLKQNPTHGRRFSPIFLLKSGILWGKTQNATTKRRKTEYGMG